MECNGFENILIHQEYKKKSCQLKMAPSPTSVTVQASVFGFMGLSGLDWMDISPLMEMITHPTQSYYEFS